MNVTALTPLVLPYLIRYLPEVMKTGKFVDEKAFEKVIEKMTDEVRNSVEPWIGKLMRQIEDHPDALRAAQLIAESPRNATYQTRMEAALEGVLAADQALAVEIKRIFDETTGAGGNYVTADRSGMAIDGSAKDSIIITIGVTQLELTPYQLSLCLYPFVAPSAILPSGCADGGPEILPDLVMAMTVYIGGEVEFLTHLALTQRLSTEYSRQVAIENLRKLPPPQLCLAQDADGRADSDILILQSQDPFGASRISYLKDLVTWASGGKPARHGVLVAVPTWRLVMLHVLSGPGVLKALKDMRLATSLAMAEAPERARLSPDVYFVAPDGRTQNVTQQSSSDHLVIETRGLIAEFLFGPQGLLKDLK